MEIRHAEPADYGRVIARLNAWWGGRDMAPMLPRLFFVHFEGTSYVVDGEDGQLAAFLIGFLSQTDPEEAYIHFVNPTNPDEPESEWQVQTNFELRHPTEGDLVLDILEGNRIGGVEFLAKLTGDA